MRRFIVLTILTLFSCSVKVSGKEPILYIFPDSVEVILHQRITNSLPNYPQGTIVSLDISFYEGRYWITLSFYSPDTAEHDLFWVKRTNRFGVIGDERYPLVSSEDYKFGTSSPKEIGTFGNRDGQIRRTTLIRDGYSISWEWIDGKINIYENNGIHKPAKKGNVSD